MSTASRDVIGITARDALRPVSVKTAMSAYGCIEL
jgi:hypothetical protein